MKARNHFIVAMVWLGASVLSRAFFDELFGWLWLASIPVYFGIFVAGLVWAVIGFKGWMRTRERLLLASAGVTLLSVALLWVFGAAVGQHIYFASKKRTYEAVVAEIKEKRLRGALTIKYDIDPGATNLRVRFVRSGMLDNYSAVIYDDSDALRRLSDVDGSIYQAAKTNREIRQLTSIFGGEMVRCRRLKRGWYYCVFT